MNETEVIDDCRQRATRRRVQLGPYVNAFLNDEELATKVPQTKLPLGHWTVVFRDSGFDTEQYFTVNNATGQVAWENEPPARWAMWLLYIVMVPLFTLMFPFAWVCERIQAAWKHYQLPRCPNCRGKLRTDSAEQCFNCGKAWHRKTDTDS